MKVKLKFGYNYIDEDDYMATITFNKCGVYEVIHQFQHEEYGQHDHTVYVIINENGETMSLSCEVVEIVEK